MSASPAASAEPSALLTVDTRTVDTRRIELAEPPRYDVEHWEAHGALPTDVWSELECAGESVEPATPAAQLLSSLDGGRSLGAVVALATLRAARELQRASGLRSALTTLPAPWFELASDLAVSLSANGTRQLTGTVHGVVSGAHVSTLLLRVSATELCQVPLDAQGVSRRPGLDMGLGAAGLCSIAFDRVLIAPSQSAYLDPVALASLTEQHRLRAAHALIAWSRQLLAATFDFLGSRPFRGSVLATQQVIRHRIADLCSCQTTLESQLRAAAVDSPGRALRVLMLCANVHDSLPEFVKDCQQLHGGRGFLSEHDAARAYRDCRSLCRLFGSKHILCAEIERQLGGLLPEAGLPRGSCSFATPEHVDFRARARRVIATALPRASAGEQESLSDFRHVHQRFAREQLTTSMVPLEHGGPGRDLSYSVALIEELMSKASASAAVSLLVAAGAVFSLVANHGTPLLREHLLPRILSGSAVIAFGITEPGGGSDLTGAMQTVAHEDGSDYVVDGRKVFITNAPVADFALVLARSSADGQPFQACLLLVPSDAPGVTASAPYDKLGLRGSPTGTLDFRSVRVPKHNLIGRAGLGLSYFADATLHERVLIAAGSLELASSCLLRVLRVLERAPELASAHTPRLLGELARVEGRRALAYHVIEKTTRGELERTDAAMLKYAACETAQRAIEVAADALECLPVSTETTVHVTRALRDSRIFSVFAGTSEMMRDTYAASLLPRIRMGVWGRDV
jgi:butyryl-CoA dehydrogenase